MSAGFRTVGLVILLLWLTACAPTPTTVSSPTPMPTPDSFTNPVLDQDFPDPDVLKIGDAYYDRRYATGYAVADDIFGPYVKAKEPLLETNLAAGLVGPGGQDIVTGPRGG